LSPTPSESPDPKRRASPAIAVGGGGYDLSFDQTGRP